MVHPSFRGDGGRRRDAHRRQPGIREFLTKENYSGPGRSRDGKIEQEAHLKKAERTDMFVAQLVAALLEAATVVIELVLLLKGRKSPEGSKADTGREE